MSNTVIIIIIALLSIISLLLAILFVTLLRKIRSASKDNFNLIQFPKETDDKIKDLIVQVQKFSYDLANSLKREINENKKVITDFDEKLKPFEKVAKEKMEELKLFKAGYEYSKYKSLLNGIIDTIEFIEDGERKIRSDTAVNKYLDEMMQSYFILTKEKLLIILDQFGIEKFEPELNTSNLNQPGSTAHFITEPTENENKVNLIHSVIRPGYKTEFKKGESIYIKKAEVKVYSLIKKDENIGKNR